MKEKILEILLSLLAALLALVIGGGGGYLFRNLAIGRSAKAVEQKFADIERKAADVEQKAAIISREAEDRNKALLVDAKEASIQIRLDAEKDLRDSRNELQRVERRLQGREENIDRRSEAFDRREKEIDVTEQRAVDSLAEAEAIKGKEQQILESIAGMSASEAHEFLMRNAEADAKHDLARLYYDLEKRMKEEADQKARRVIILAIQRLASDVVSENSTSKVPLPNDEMKGRLIGREGRNIRAIEAATGVELIVDDTPEAVTISCFDPVRREIARMALASLVQDGRIHPTRIEEMVERAKKEVDEEIWRAGEQAVLDSGVKGLNPEIMKLLGRLKYRYSYGSNVLNHSVQVCLIAGMLAAEVGANVQVAKGGGLMHDIGKALSHEMEGPHAEIGAEMAARYGIAPEIQRAIMEHHDEEKGSVEAFLVTAADAISAARPGARKDTLEHYVQRLKALEEVANSFPGVEKTFAIQAGREVRILVKADVVDDIGSTNLARDVVKKIEDTLVYPGQIKVTVVRETRVVEYAR
jgi:ribonuclease Y